MNFAELGAIAAQALDSPDAKRLVLSALLSLLAVVVIGLALN